MKAKKAVVLISGGADSATTLAIAKSQGFVCYALTIDYHQRNHPEINAAKNIVMQLGVEEHRVIQLDIGHWGGSALTDKNLKIPQAPATDIPITYVPARNTIFLSTALAWAEVLGAFDIFFGANIIDYSNYPDCRPEYIKAFEKVANLGTRAGVQGKSFRIHAPLTECTKADIIKKGTELGVDFSLTVSCYDPDAEGAACGTCDACRFRTNAFQTLKIKDVTRYCHTREKNCGAKIQD